MDVELIPFKNKRDAEEFLKDHYGEAFLGFQVISIDVIKRSD